MFEKTVATFGTFALLYTIMENFILPLVPTSRQQSFFRSLLDLALPFMIAYLLLFYIIFGTLKALKDVDHALTIPAQNAFAMASLSYLGKLYHISAHSATLRIIIFVDLPIANSTRIGGTLRPGTNSRGSGTNLYTCSFHVTSTHLPGRDTISQKIAQCS